MTKTLGAPVATDDPTDQADFLELSCFRTADGNVSTEDLIRQLRRSGSTDAVRRPEIMGSVHDVGSEVSAAIAEDAYAELESRAEACGGDRGSYPFELFDTVLQLKPEAVASPYVFLLLLSQYGIAAGPRGLYGERVFEDLCREAARGYMGGAAPGAQAVHFGFPRRLLPRNFPDALDELCKLTGDMIANGDAPRRRDQKDAKLDIVAWRDFPDRRDGKLIGFGQCAAGKTDWRSKATELQVSSFAKRWLRQQPSVDPIRLFFVPLRLSPDVHRDLCLDGGIVFDRCRIAHFCNTLRDPQLLKDCERWSKHVIKRWLA
jgi:hypothetical protein